jgi:hypothetical protein
MSKIAKFGVMLCAAALLATVAFADVETRGTVVRVDKSEDQLVVKTEKGEETLLLTKETKGLAHAKEGAKVVIKFTEKDGQPKVIEIIPQDRGSDQKAPR